VLQAALLGVGQSADAAFRRPSARLSSEAPPDSTMIFNPGTP
jgi:hypothetical protein